MDLYSRPKPLSELLDYSVEDEVSVMEVRSDTIEPLNSGTYHYRFRIEPFGFMGGESVLLFKLDGGVVGNKLRANIVSGGLGAIKTARMLVGDTIIQETRDFHDVSMADYVIKKDRDSLNRYHAHYWGNAFHSDVATGADATEATTTGQVQIGADSGIYFGVPGAGTGAVVRSQAVTTNTSDNYQIGIRLDELFPVLQGQQLPLFLFDEYRIYIDIEFNTSDVYANNIATLGATVSYVAGATDITPADVKLQMDYLIFPSKVLDETRDRTLKDGGLQLSYYSNKVIEKTLPAGTAGTQQDAEFRLGLTDFEVHSITMLKQLSVSTAFPIGPDFDGRNRSLLCGMVVDGMPSESYQVEVNGIPMYPFFKESKASQHDQVEFALGDTQKMERAFYYTDDNDIASELTPKTSGMQGTYSPLAISLRSGAPVIWSGGTVIGQYPINWRYRRTPKASSATMNATDGPMDIKFVAKVSSMTKVISAPDGMRVETVGV